ncbi:GNAT family N-acetyltransferase [Bradymonas sediminis]|uniref:GNAT family N-acetyltransferase n=1 Tax=Bradymonas sediminis TaxID=1548548 RepID=A0A2Z4FI21_9DELT|nr:GNAT family N-acetyltransferase [Bradymonas sediminis]AWV88582.1 GNAT family N-acetyltransferase [Bradymonas sediminis]TDP77726.1 putative N-acetyltransferase YhbS [Bradymonas sediminis]
MLISNITPADLPQVDRIQRLAYGPELIESIDALNSRLQLAPDFAFAAREQPDCLGYLFAHPWPADQSPGLNHIIKTLPPNADAIHLHDMAVDPNYGGRGIGRSLLNTLLDAADAAGYAQVTLVAVQGADTFWTKMGFEALRPAEGYDDSAILMRFNLR